MCDVIADNVIFFRRRNVVLHGFLSLEKLILWHFLNVYQLSLKVFFVVVALTIINTLFLFALPKLRTCLNI